MISLIRHCTVLINYSVCDYELAKKRIEEYNNTSNLATEEISAIKHHLGNFLQEQSTTIFVSSSPRAHQTAKHIFGQKRKLTISDQFVEFDLNIFPIPFFKLKFKMWLLISRILWFLGIAKTNRNFILELKRAHNCADLLAQQSLNGSVVLVAHDLLNFFIERYLRKQNYKRTYKINNGCFSITKLELL